MLMAPPSETPKIAARSLPAASMTARTSSMRSSRVGALTARSERPVPLVEHDHAAERPEARQEMRHGRVVPVEVDVGDEAGDVDEVERALPEHLVGDADFAALGVVGVGLHGVALSRSCGNYSSAPPLPNGPPNGRGRVARSATE